LLYNGNVARELVIPIEDFEQRLKALLEEVASTGEEIVVTEHGRPLVRVAREVAAPIREDISGMVKVLGDIESPLEDEWQSDKW
jgi:prevent-host-death family protein